MTPSSTWPSAKLLGTLPAAEPVRSSLPEAVPVNPAALEQETRQWAMFLHLSLLAGFVVPYAGLIVPILIWQLKKAELPGLDVHGKNVLNWIISVTIYAIGCALLFFVFIGIPLLFALIVVGVVFPIIAGIKANQGEVWKYPLAITFLK